MIAKYLEAMFVLTLIGVAAALERELYNAKREMEKSHDDDHTS
jgi:hypothetical protein